MVVTVAQQCECTQCHWAVHLEMVKMGNFVFWVFCHNLKNKVWAASWKGLKGWQWWITRTRAKCTQVEWTDHRRRKWTKEAGKQARDFGRVALWAAPNTNTAGISKPAQLSRYTDILPLFASGIELSLYGNSTFSKTDYITRSRPSYSPTSAFHLLCSSLPRVLPKLLERLHVKASPPCRLMRLLSSKHGFHYTCTTFRS